jgi:hypothetical protein
MAKNHAIVWDQGSFLLIFLVKNKVIFCRVSHDTFA